MDSHLQTRTLSDALDAVDEVLKSRHSALAPCAERRHLAGWFGKERPGQFFDSWAFTAREFDQAILEISRCAPQLASRLERPADPRDFTVAGNCSLELRFSSDPNGADPIPLQLCTGDWVQGATVTARRTRLYANQLIEIPAQEEKSVYFFSPPDDAQKPAAQLAQELFAGRGEATRQGLTLKFPAARTSRLVDYPWVKELVSTCGQYYVKNHLSAGEALVDHNGFFARETQIVQMKWLCIGEDFPKVVIDRPFVVFFADVHGVHAAAWFGWDSFSAAPQP